VVVTHVEASGTRSGTRPSKDQTTASYSGSVDLTVDDTLTRNFEADAELSRTHDAVGSASATYTFTETNASRALTESAVDSVRRLTWDLPRANNPFPVSGSMVRNVSVHLEATQGERSGSRDAKRRVEVDFPADAQGNVTLSVDAVTCNLNLITHAVSNCS
jgi:hypothetical protein